MVNDAARILKVAGRKGKSMVGYQGLRLATITSLEPFKMAVDGIDSEYLAGDVVINAQMSEFGYIASISAQIADFSGQTDINGTASVDGYSRSFSMNGGNISQTGALSSGEMNITTKDILSVGDRVAVSSVNMNKFLILCKVVSV